MLTIEEVSDNEVKLGGRFDASQAEKATTALSGYQTTIIIDLSDLDYISSMGLSVLVQTYKRLNEKGEGLRLTNLNRHVRDVFKFTRLDQVFDIVDTD